LNSDNTTKTVLYENIGVDDKEKGLIRSLRQSDLLNDMTDVALNTA